MTDKSDSGLAGKAIIAGAAIGSAAIAAALLYVTKRKLAKADDETVYLPPHPEDAPETD